MATLYKLTFEGAQGLVEVGQPAPLAELAERVKELVAKFEAWEQRGCPDAELGEAFAQIEGADLVAERVGGDEAYLWSGEAWEVF